MNRREFLRTAALTGAVSAASGAAAWADEPRPAPSNRLTLGFIGVGGMGGLQCYTFLDYAETQIVAVCDVRQEPREMRRAQVEERYAQTRKSGTYKGCAVYSDFRELLARDDIDAVVIATPDHWHAIIAIAAVQAGKDVYCQKLLSLTIREAQAMRRAYREAKAKHPLDATLRIGVSWQSKLKLIGGAISPVQRTVGFSLPAGY